MPFSSVSTIPCTVMTLPLIRGPTSWPGMGHVGILVWGMWSVGAETADTETGHPQEWTRPRQPGSGLLRQNRQARK